MMHHLQVWLIFFAISRFQAHKIINHNLRKFLSSIICWSIYVNSGTIMRKQSQNSEVASIFPLRTSRADKYFSILLAYYRDTITVQYAGKTAAD